MNPSQGDHSELGVGTKLGWTELDQLIN